MGTDLTESVAGRLAAAFSTYGDVATPVATADSVDQTGDNYARLGTPAGASVSADIAGVSAQISAIGSGTGAALNYPVVEDNASAPIKGVSAVGTETGTYANTLANDGTTHRIDSAANAIDWVYGFNVGAARASSKIDIRANMAAVGDTVTVSAYNFTTSSWDTRATITGTAETLYDIPLLASHTGTGADEGKVYIRFVFAEGDAGALVIDEAYVQAQQSGSLAGYALGAIWVNTAASNTNTVPYVDGTADNPVSTWAAALTLSTALGIKRFKIAASSSITLTGNSTGYEMLGDGLWSLALGSQDISSAYILKASLSGVASGSDTIIEDGLINPGTSTGPAYFVRSGFNTTAGSPFLAAAAGQYAFVDCVSMVPGSGTPYFNFAGTGSATGINFRRWSGGSNVTLDSNCTATMEVVTGGGQTFVTGGGNVEVRGICRAVTVTSIAGSTTQIAAVTGPVTVNGTGGTVNLYGVTAAVTDNSGGTVTINNYAVSRATINVEADTALADYDGPTNAEMEARTLLAAVYFDPATDTVATVTTVTNGVTLADDAITSAKFDETTAWPLKAADAGVTYIARTGADGDTLETISDQQDLAALEVTAQDIKAKTDNLPADPAATSDIPSVGDISDGVWEETLADHLGVGTTGLALNAAGVAGDPWLAALPGAYLPGSAGYIVGENLDEAVSTRAAAADLAAVASDVTDVLTELGDVDTAIAALPVAIDVLLTAEHGDGLWTNDAGAGSIMFPYLVLNPSSDPIPHARVVVTTDEDGNNRYAMGYSDAFGYARFHLDAGTYYFWTYAPGYAVSRSDPEVVV